MKLLSALGALICVFVMGNATELELPCNPTCQHGVCVATHGVLSCRCEENWFGDDCSQFVCDRDEDSNPCMNNGTCYPHRTNSTEYQCACGPDFWGEHCQYEVNADVCLGQNCSGNGACFGAVDGSYECVCNENYHGVHCQDLGSDPCNQEHVQHCFGHGTCSSRARNFNCSCDEGYSSIFSCDRLKPTHDICHQLEGQLCQNNGICEPTGSLSYTCKCPPEFGGVNCTEPYDPCPAGTCLNGGTCEMAAGGHYFQCSCPEGYTGWMCETPSLEPTPPPTCVNGNLTLSCACPAGYTGARCELRDRCAESPCEGNSRCVSVEEDFVCICPEGRGGKRCELDIQCATNDTQESTCPHAECAADGNCQEQCNSPECGFDGGDCAGHPWEACYSGDKRYQCQLNFLNGRCDVDCNTAECLFDGGECSPAVSDCPEADQCMDVGEDGVCETRCNTPQCPYDGKDCTAQVEEFAPGRLILILVSDQNRPFETPYKEYFLSNLSRLINSVPVLETVTSLTTAQQLRDRDIQPDSVVDRLVYEVVMRVDVTHCRQYCPQNAEEVEDWILAAISNGQSSFGDFSIRDVSNEPDDTSEGLGAEMFGVIGMGVVLVAAAIVIVGVLIGKRKRVRAKLWRPTSPSDSATAGEGTSSSQAGSNATPAADSSLALESKDYLEAGSKKARMTSNGQVEWVNVTAPESEVVIGQQGKDNRKWKMVHTRDVGKLVQQYRRHNGCSVDVDAPGPGGFTPLMLVVMRRPGTISSLNYQSRSSSESSSDDQTALIPAAAAAAISRGPIRHHMMMPPVDSTVSALVEAKANLDAVNDYGQTALHLAAACSRPEYVDLLVEAGANPNIQDNWGQSPLHAAIGAGAEGSFMVLLNCPRSKINLKSDGGITPLMAAVKMVNIFMVKQLLKRDSEVVSSVDDDGRTAVHWAAMVDNIEALRVLIKCGAETIKDAQDNKGQTPLFLACREGSIMCVKHLIDCFANVTLLDNLEQSPMQIAMQKQYGDIVELLRTSPHGPLYMRPPNGFMSEVPSYPSTSHAPHHQLVTPPSSKKKKSAKSAVSAASAASSFHGKFVGGYPPVTTSSAGNNIAMTELHNNTASSIGQPSSYAHHHSPPNYPPPSVAAHSPPLPPNCTTYPAATSTHTQCTLATTEAPGYTPSSYEQVLPPAPVSVAPHTTVSTSLHHSAVPDGYPLYPVPPSSGDVGTHPLQHLPVVSSEAELQTTSAYAPTHAPAMTPESAPFMHSSSAYSPPQSGGSVVSQHSPQSAGALQPSPVSYGTSPPSLTPSPESQQQQTIAAVGSIVHVEPAYNNYPPIPNHFQQHQFMSSCSTPV